MENAIGAAKEQKGQVESIVQRYNWLIQTEESKIEDRAEKMVSDKIVCLERQYQVAVGAYKSFWSMMLFFSAMLVVLLALKNKVFVPDLLIFLTGLGETLRGYVNGYAGGTISAVVTISGTVFVCGIITIAGYFYKKFLDKNKIRMCDRMTAVVMFLEMAVILFAGEMIRNVIRINLIGVYLMMVLAYVLVRSVVQMKDHEMRKRLVVNVLGVLGMVVVLICAMRGF